MRAAVSAGVLIAIAVPGALPSWGDAPAQIGGEFAPGALELRLDAGRGSAGDRADVDVAVDALVPGDSKAVVLTLANAGEAMFTYSATASSVGPSGADLSPALRYSVVVGGAVAGGPRTGSCAGGTTSFGPAPLSASPRKIVPVSSPGSSLSPGETQSICIVVALPRSTGNSAQGDSAEATIVFSASEAL